jgi:hypothetical protein
MKKIIQNLENQLEKLRELISSREDYVLDRSEKWQESEKCEDYEDKTLEIEYQADELESVIEELKELQ